MGTLAAKVILDPFALGDRSYNDLIYQGVEEAAAEQSWADNWNREGNFWMLYHNGPAEFILYHD